MFFLKQIKALLNMCKAPLYLAWPWSHQNLSLNDKADYFAKLATRWLPPPLLLPLSVAISAYKLPVEGRPTFSDPIALIPHHHNRVLYLCLPVAENLIPPSPFFYLNVPHGTSLCLYHISNANLYQHTRCQQQLDPSYVLPDAPDPDLTIPHLNTTAILPLT